MEKCVSERGSQCAGKASAMLVALEGGLRTPKCDPCVAQVQRRSGAFDEPFRVERIPAGRMRCFDA